MPKEYSQLNSITMKRKTLKDKLSSSQTYMKKLISIFNNIQLQLKKLPHFDETSLVEVNDLLTELKNQSTIQRQVKRENQIRLFNQTLELVSSMKNKKYQTRKSDMIIKFSLVTEVLGNRIKEQMLIKGDGKQSSHKTIQCIQNLKQKLIDWGQKQSNLKQNSKENTTNRTNNQYTLKFIFSESTRPTTANVSRVISNTHKRQHHMTTTNEGLLGYEGVNSVNVGGSVRNSVQKGQKQKQGKDVLKRRITNYGSYNPNQKSNTLRRYTKNYFQTQYQKKTNNFINPQEQLQIKQNQQSSKSLSIGNQIQKDQQKNQEKQTLKTEKVVDWQMNHSERSQSIIIGEDNQAKKSNYYISQNYIRSRKNIENMTLFVSKIKKKASNANYTINLSSQSQENSVIQDIMIDPTDACISRKFLTRKYIPEEYIQVNPTKSQKSIPRRSTINGNYRQISVIKQKPSVHFQSHRTQNEEIIIPIDEVAQQPYIAPKKSKFSPFNFQYINETFAESRGLVHSQSQSKQLGDFYSTLTELRQQFAKPDCYYQNRSIFFHQQNILWEEQKRLMQRVLNERKHQHYFHQFQMPVQVNSRVRQQKQRAERNDTFNSACRQLKHYKIPSLIQVSADAPSLQDM